MPINNLSIAQSLAVIGIWCWQYFSPPPSPLLPPQLWNDAIWVWTKGGNCPAWNRRQFERRVFPYAAGGQQGERRNCDFQKIPRSQKFQSASSIHVAGVSFSLLPHVSSNLFSSFQMLVGLTALAIISVATFAIFRWHLSLQGWAIIFLILIEVKKQRKSDARSWVR